MTLDQILRELSERKGSDLHLKAGRPPLMRISGELLPSEYRPLTPDEIRDMLYGIMTERQIATLDESRAGDFSYEIEGLARFRVNIFFQKGMIGAVLRMIPIEIPTIDSLGLPSVLKDMVAQKQGLILVTGPTGSGKSTTLAAMINHVNDTRASHLITIEDPIEFVYTDKRSTINQRELGADTLTLQDALRHALRQDPDIILMGEMRDAETMEFGMHAAETGHLVFSTLHTNDAKQTVDRVLDTFSTEKAGQIRMLLALTLGGVISQRLVKRNDGNGRIAALEILVNSPNVQQLILEGKTREIEKAMAKASTYYRMQTFNQALLKHVQDGVINEKEALENSANPDELKLALRGIMKESSSGMPAFTPDSIKDEGDKPDSDEPAKPKITRGFTF